MLPGECLVLIYVKRINMQEPTGTALDSFSFSFNTNSEGCVKTGGRSHKSMA